MIDEDNKTVWCGNLAEQITEELLYELFLQAGPLEKVRIARDRDGRQRNFAFITYCHEVSVPYALHLLRGTSLFHKTLTLQCRGRMAILPPPIRCVGPEPLEFMVQPNVAQQFADMTAKLGNDDYRVVNSARVGHDLNEKMSMQLASLQGNLHQRHHPYRGKDKGHNRDDYRQRDNGEDHYSNNQRNRHQNSWRDRRNHNKRGNNYYNR